MTSLLAIVVLVGALLLSGLRIAQEYQRGVMFRLGRCRHLRGPGLFWIMPLGVERSIIIDIRTRTVSAEQQETITRDSVTIKVNAVPWYRKGRYAALPKGHRRRERRGSRRWRVRSFPSSGPLRAAPTTGGTAGL